MVRKQHKSARVYTLGIGTSVDRLLVDGLAEAGGAVAEYIAPGENANAMVMRQLRRALVSPFENVKVQWDEKEGSAASASYGGDSVWKQAPKTGGVSLHGGTMSIYALSDDPAQPLPVLFAATVVFRCCLI